MVYLRTLAPGARSRGCRPLCSSIIVLCDLCTGQFIIVAHKVGGHGSLPSRSTPGRCEPVEGLIVCETRLPHRTLLYGHHSPTLTSCQLVRSENPEEQVEYTYVMRQKPGIKKVIRKGKLSDRNTDAAYWRKQPYSARLAALEEIRQEYHRWRYGAEPRFQRVYSVVKR